MNRRSFLTTAAAVPLAAAQLAAAQQLRGLNLRLGIDLFSIRSQGWTPFEYLDYSSKWGAKVVHFSEIRFIGNLEKDHLKKVGEYAKKLGIEVEIGMRSICPTSTLFDLKQGTGEEQIGRMIDAAVTVGSPIVRAFLGQSADRSTKIPLEQHIENAAKVLRGVRSKAMDNGKKIAIENHAGDMQGRELKSLIEQAGKDFVGACLDSGNPCWTVEDPHVTLEHLAPYVLTSHVRDSMVWRTPEGAAVQWTRLGEGNVGIAEWIKKYVELCPGKAMSLEIIVTNARQFPYLQPKFWDAYRKQPAWEFARFAAIAEKGKPQADRPKLSQPEAIAREREDLEVSLQWLQALQSA